ncbi:hypothetical protein E4T49_06459 [Aureobasidium sp. EXF-10728]|nr:hypothetical protein E4T49_06459 [Aureobasidium sp. EXF-10728]
MKAPINTCTFLLGILCAQSTTASPLLPLDESTAVSIISRRDGSHDSSAYVPNTSRCPLNAPAIRQASTLSPQETAWLTKRRNATVTPMRELLGRVSIPGFDTHSYMDHISGNSSLLPNIAIAFSGGGYRALMNGAGALAAFDERTSGANRAGHLGGLLQSSTYMSGLSGGSWLVGSFALNGFQSVQDILGQGNDNDALWRLDEPITRGPNDGLLAAADYLKTIVHAVEAKNEAGFKTSLTDIWGRALSYQLVSPADGGPKVTFSSIQQDRSFTSGNMPMPIIVTDGRSPDQLVIDGNSTVYEINPWEFGTFDPTTFAFAPLEYVGSNFSNGVIEPNAECVTGFDNAGYIMGTSSSLFNQELLQRQDGSGKGFFYNAVNGLLTEFSDASDDVARYPNPFYGINPESNEVHDQRLLTLVDGGEDLQNLPLHPIIQPERGVDVIFAVDSSADTLKENGDTNWPNGTALIASYKRSFLDIANGTSFPPIPDSNTFVNLGLNSRPTLFGCDVTNTTSTTPLIVYLPNAPYAYLSNVSTFQMAYSHLERENIVQNGYDVATMGNATVDAEWPVCVGCAILHRSFGKTATTVPDACDKCYKKFCWDGTVDDTETSYHPTLKFEALKTEDQESGGMQGVAFDVAMLCSFVVLALGFTM